MSHRFFVASEQIEGNTVSFSAEQLHQLRTVLRLRPGETIRVFDGRSAFDYRVVLTSVEQGRIEGTLAHAAEPATRLVAYPTLVSRDKFEHVLQKLTEVGAAVVVPVLTARSLVREPPDERRLIRWRAILREAAEQSGRGTIPILAAARPFSSALALATAEGTTLVAYEHERQASLRDALAGSDRLEPVVRAADSEAELSSVQATLATEPRYGRRTVSFFVGPEGGYTPEEAAAAERAGARLITLGPRILRTETASPLVAALVLYELGDLSSAHASDDQS